MPMVPVRFRVGGTNLQGLVPEEIRDAIKRAAAEEYPMESERESLVVRRALAEQLGVEVDGDKVRAALADRCKDEGDTTSGQIRRLLIAAFHEPDEETVEDGGEE